MIKYYVAVGTLSILGVTGAMAFLGFGETRRMQEFTEAFRARQVENGAAMFENSCRPCHGPQGKGIEGVAPALNAADLFNGERLANTGYAGSVEDYVRSTIAAGRPVPSQGTNYPQRMPTWSQQFGGPLRGDQIESLVAFVMNWEERALAEGAPTPETPPEEAVGTNIKVELPPGDAASGEALSESFGCTGCHILSAVGPPWRGEPQTPGIAERARERLAQEDYTGNAETEEEYLVESIVLPNEFVVEGYAVGVMPPDYGSRMTAQQLADVVAYLLTLE